MGPAIGGFLATQFGFAAPAFVAACMALGSTSLTTFYLKEHQHVRDTNAKTGLNYYKRVLEYLRDARLRPLLTIFLFFALPFSLYVSMFSLFAMIELKFTPEDVGWFLMFVGLLGVVWQGAVVRPLVKWLGETVSLRLGLISMVLGLVGLAVVKNPILPMLPTLAIIAIFFSFGTGITRPTLTSLLTQFAPKERKGGVLGVSSSLESASRSVAPILGGWLIGGLHPNWIGYAGGAFALVAVAVAFTMRTNPHEMVGRGAR